MTKEESKVCESKIISKLESLGTQIKPADCGLRDVYIDNQKKFSFMIINDSENAYYLLTIAYEFSSASITSNEDKSYEVFDEILISSGFS